MVWIFLLIVSLAILAATPTLRADAAAEDQPAGDSHIKSQDAAATVGGGSGKAIDSRTLSEFDNCLANIDFTVKSIEVVQEEARNCKEISRGKSKPLANPNFEDVKERIQKQVTQEQNQP